VVVLQEKGEEEKKIRIMGWCMQFPIKGDAS